MTAETKRTILDALASWRGDDFERASAAFRGLSDAKMDEEYGQSGRTRSEILQGHANHAKRVDAAIAEVNQIRGE